MVRLPPPLPSLLRRVRRAAGVLRRRVAELLALLALLGGAAFQMRSGGGLSPQLYAALQAQAAAPQQLGHPAHHAAPNQLQHSHLQHGQQSRHPERQGHAAHDPQAHCPFCVTQAFGEAASPFVLDPGPPDHRPAATPQAPAPARPLPRWADARAPPQRLSPRDHAATIHPLRQT